MTLELERFSISPYRSFIFLDRVENRAANGRHGFQYCEQRAQPILNPALFPHFRTQNSGDFASHRAATVKSLESGRFSQRHGRVLKFQKTNSPVGKHSQRIRRACRLQGAARQALAAMARLNGTKFGTLRKHRCFPQPSTAK